jgi:PKD repeat protein
LTTAANPSEQGSVSPSGENWYNAGTEVALSASGTGIYGFLSWSGDLSGSLCPTSIIMTGPKNIVANFDRPTLIIANPRWFDNPVPAVGTYTYDAGSTVSCSITSPVSGMNYGAFADGFESGTISEWTMGETFNWFLITEEKHSGSYSARSGGIGSNHSNYIERTFTIGPGGGEVSFWWKVSSRPTYHTLKFYIDGWAQATISGVTSWAQSAYPLAAGTRTLRWEYTKDFRSAQNLDRGWLDDIAVNNTLVPALNTRHVCTGYTGTGSCPSGSGTTVTFTIMTTSSITWNWTTQYKLTTSVNPAGWGTVTVSPVQDWYDEGSSVQLTAILSAEIYTFSNWSGDLTGSENPTTIIMNKTKNITADFIPTPRAVAVSSLYGSPNPPPGTTYYPNGTSVTVSCGPTPYAGPAGAQYVNTGWTGGSGDIPATGSASSYGPFTITQNCAITWTWETQYKLMTTVSPPDSGSVTWLPDATWYDPGTVVQLTAVAHIWWLFTNWSGDLSGTTNPQNLTMNGPKSVTANFAAQVPVADFTSSRTSGYVPLTVRFTDASTGNITSWSWDFGAGASPATANTRGPHSVIYTTAGLKTVSLTLTGPGGSDTKTEVDYINVMCPAPVAKFTANQRTGTVPLTVNFTDTSTGTITSRAWDFNNDGITDSTEQNPSYVYTDAGIYTVKLTAIGPGGSDTETKVDYINVVPPAPVANFTADPMTGAAPLTVNFTDASTGSITSWAWDFNNDGTTDSAVQNPSYTYSNPGPYTVKLTVTGPGGSDDETKAGYISVTGAIVADFTGTPTSGNVPLTVQFTDASTGCITSWSWDFGSGATSGTATTPGPHSVTYSTAGLKTVSLTVAGPAGSDTESKVNFINVLPPAPVVNFSAWPTSGNAPLTVQFTDNSTGVLTSWAWDFDSDGTTDSMSQNPLYTYNNIGTYTVKLTVSGPGGAVEKIKTSYVIATAPPSGYFWTRRMGGADYDYAYAICADGNGNIYVTGCFENTVNFAQDWNGSDTKVSGGDQEIFITKIDTSGNYCWTHGIGGLGLDRAYAVCTDGSGNVYVAGSFEESVNFAEDWDDTDTKVSAGDWDIFITKIDASGNYLWTRRIGGSGYWDEARAICVDGTGDLYVAGYFSGTVNFAEDWGESDTKTNSGIFVTKMDAGGNYLWTHRMGALDAYAICADVSGNVYVAGLFRGTVNFAEDWGGTETKTYSGCGDAFITKITSNGSYAWTHRIGSTWTDAANAICTDGSGNLYIAGEFGDTVNFAEDWGGTETKTADNFDIFITKIDANGRYVRTHRLGGSGYDAAYAVCTDESGNVYVAGECSDNVNFAEDWGGSQTKWEGGVFVTKIDASGGYGWTHVMDAAYAYGVCVDGGSNLYLTGVFWWDYVNFAQDWGGSQRKMNAGEYDIFITKIER